MSDLNARIEELEEELAVTRQAGQELATALWALVLAQQPAMSLSRDQVVAHAETVAKKYTSEADREQLSAALKRAKGLGEKWAP